MFFENKKLVPPDGGWGWLVVIGVSTINLCTRSIETSFGLLFGDILKDLGIETTGASVIMSTLEALINFSGIFVGPLIRSFSYRKVALVGSVLVALGLITTSWANSMAHVLITYSVINGLGVGLATTAAFVGLNNYFVKRRGQAVGFSSAGTALGMMLMPQAVGLLLDEFDFRGAMILLGGFSLNALVGSALLQPAKWHYIEEKKSVSNQKGKQEMETIREDGEEEGEEEAEANNLIAKNSVIKTPEELKAGEITRTSTLPKNFSTVSFAENRGGKRRSSKESIVNSYSLLDFTGSSIQLQIDNKDLLKTPDPSRLGQNIRYPGVQFSSQIEVIKELQQDHLKLRKAHQKSFWKKVVEIMDFDLLKDPIYLNLIFGLSAFYVAEQNFKVVMPFFYQSIGYTKQDIAIFLTIQALTDLLARLILPTICDKLDVSKRTLFMCGAFLLALSRSVLAQQHDYVWIMVLLVVSGFLRGAVFINFSISISEYATLEKLPAALGLHNVGKGIFVVLFGPLLGKIRDVSQSYPTCIHSQTFLMMACVFAWSIEYFFRYFWVDQPERSDMENTTA